MTASTATTEIMVFTNPDFGPSRRMREAIDDLVDDRPGIRVVEVDVWHNPDTLVQHDVITVPTTIISVGGEERGRLAGLRSGRALRRALDRVAEPRVAATPTPALNS